MKIKMFEMKNLRHDTHGNLIITEEKICEHEVKAIALEYDLPWSCWCSCMTQDLEQWKWMYLKIDCISFPPEQFAFHILDQR